ncbi:MAG TPA: hypothetical protein VGI16_05630 [Candidatus Acidoferrum sp.]|jgi:hypothetical protein
MADWKQITARIRRARTAKDPVGQLSNLYEKTRDAMVAFELARFFETSGQNADAAKWYSTAAEHFRRADWKTKAQEAAVRLGGESAQNQNQNIDPDRHTEGHLASIPITIPEPGEPFAQSANAFEAIVMPDPAAADEETSEASSDSAEPDSAKPSADLKRRRRGRRGGRNRRKGPAISGKLAASSTSPSEAPASRRHAPPPPDDSPDSRSESSESRALHPPLPIESIPDSAGPAVRGRYGDPGLSSRISLLEMQFRRLLSCTPVKIDEADRAPVGPGVFLLTDSDLTSYYYVEACQTLRIAVANLLRGNSSRRGADSIKPQLAENLGIPEARVTKYLADHCVVRWLQLDEGASHFAHFVIAVLRPILNE